MVRSLLSIFLFSTLSLLSKYKSVEIEHPIKQDTSYHNKLKQPLITSLPFGYSSNWANIKLAKRFYKKMIYDNPAILDSRNGKGNGNKLKSFDLPPIKSIKYFAFSRTDTDICTDGKPFSKYINLSKYRLRLPNIGNLQCYYWCDYQNDNAYPNEVRENCIACIPFEYYGYLILYNPTTLQATVLTIYFDTQPEDFIYYRFFYIDKNYNIILKDYIDTDYKPANSLESHLISISKTGEVSIKKIK